MEGLVDFGILFVMCRELNEIMKFKDHFNHCYLVRVDRPDTTGNWGNQSDSEVMLPAYDYIVTRIHVGMNSVTEGSEANPHTVPRP
ncbi:unnamed protein product [marine sediment metagenome]|uniref:Uncharacterized protein n=1 Tax=marine sediment metagenome TaxID=412755 RepID=X1C681_9ZZZZ